MKSGPSTSADRALSRRELVTSAAQGVALGGLAVAAATLGSGVTPLSTSQRIPASILGAGHAAGHLLRGGARFPPPETAERKAVVIVGGGIAGLSAAWRLRHRGVEDVVLLELDDALGGNSRGGANATSSYPWGAHYLPIPGPDAVYVRALLEEIGVITGYDDRGRPFYDELALCGAPHERLMIHGRWQESLIPNLGQSDEDRRQCAAFSAEIARLREAIGVDGKHAFTIPMDLSSTDPAFRALDRISMAQFLADRGWDSPYLAWYVNYCCRDDFGATAAMTSAWAGVHYFAARSAAAANADEHAVLTWPDGNAFLMRALRERAAGEQRVDAVVYDVSGGEGGAPHVVDYFDVKTQKSRRIEADAVIFAAPRFVALRVLKAYREHPPAWASAFEYAPWMVANVTLGNLPDGEKSEESRHWRFAWDNVSYTSPSLGYICATHQTTGAFHRHTVLTHYWPLTDDVPKIARTAAYSRSAEQWRDMVVKDLGHMHAGIEAHVERVDLWIWGHGMIRPSPGFLWGAAREAALAPENRIFFAHSDMSGFSIFEEAQYRGVLAADAAFGLVT